MLMPMLILCIICGKSCFILFTTFFIPNQCQLWSWVFQRSFYFLFCRSFAIKLYSIRIGSDVQTGQKIDLNKYIKRHAIKEKYMVIGHVIWSNIHDGFLLFHLNRWSGFKFYYSFWKMLHFQYIAQKNYFTIMILQNNI